jgi:hypothetical protein
MSASSLRAGATRASRRLAVAAAMVVGTVVVSGCVASQYERVSCTSNSRQSIFVLEAQAVPSATLMPCANPLPGGWSVGGFEVRSGLARFWLDSDRAGARAAEARLTSSCNVAGATQLAPTASRGGLLVQRYEAPAAQQPPATVRYYLFTGGCVTYRLAFSRQTTPALFDQADQFLGFTTRARYVNGVRRNQRLTLCGAGAPPCSG